MLNNEAASFRVVDKAQRRALQLPDLGKVITFRSYWDDRKSYWDQKSYRWSWCVCDGLGLQALRAGLRIGSESLKTRLRQFRGIDDPARSKTFWITTNSKIGCLAKINEILMSFRDIRVVQSRSRPPKPPKPPKRSKEQEKARSQKKMFDQLDRLNAPLRPGPPYDDQVIYNKWQIFNCSFCFLSRLFLICNHHTIKSKNWYHSNKTKGPFLHRAPLCLIHFLKAFFCMII